MRRGSWAPSQLRMHLASRARRSLHHHITSTTVVYTERLYESKQAVTTAIEGGASHYSTVLATLYPRFLSCPILSRFAAQTCRPVK